MSPRWGTATGRILRVMPGQGHGFLNEGERGRELYFHRSDSPGDEFNRLSEGDEVTFELIEDRLSGPRAIHIKKETSMEG